MLDHKKYITSIPFSGLFNWSVQYLSEKKISFNTAYPMVRIGDFLKRNRTVVNIQDDIRYKRVTVKVRNGGVTQRDETIGKSIGTKRQFMVSEGQFIQSKIDARNGAMGIIPAELEGAVVTQDFLPYDIDRHKINPKYLVLVSTTKEFIAFCQTCSSGTTNRQRVEEGKFLDIKIPLPSIEEQNGLVEAYDAQMRRAAEQENTALNKQSDIETYVSEKLDIIDKSHTTKAGMQFTTYQDLSVWGVERLQNKNYNSVLTSNRYPNVKLGTLVLINPTTSLKKLQDSTKMSFIPMECISDLYGEWIDKRTGERSKSSGYTKFQEGDLIWARITPCMQNGKSAIVSGLENGFGYGSTEYHVLRNYSDKVILNYIHILLRLSTVLQNATSFFTGSAGQQRVPKSYLEDLSIPLPPIEVQAEIAKHVGDLKEQIKKLRIQAAENRTQALKAFEQKIFE